MVLSPQPILMLRALTAFSLSIAKPMKQWRGRELLLPPDEQLFLVSLYHLNHPCLVCIRLLSYPDRQLGTGVQQSMLNYTLAERINRTWVHC